MAQALYVVKNHVDKFAAMPRRSLRGKTLSKAIKDLSKDTSITHDVKAQILTELMVRHPAGFSTAIQQFNKSESDDVLGKLLENVSHDPGLKQLFDDTYNGRFTAQDRMFNRTISFTRLFHKVLMPLIQKQTSHY